MKSTKQILTVLMTLIITFSTLANNINVIEKSGHKSSIEIDRNDIKNKGIKSGNESMIFFENITVISTDDFDMYEKLISKTQKHYKNLKVNYTGEGNVNSLRLEKLKKKRAGADVARGAGGVMMILGVLSGNRGLTAAGLATNGAGRIARDINDDRTSNAQTDMLNDLEKRTRAAENQTEEAKLKKAYGEENVEGVKALIDNNHARALALANVGETSKIEDHRISAVYLKAMIAADQKDQQQEEIELQRMVELDSQLATLSDAKEEINDLMSHLESLRNQ